ncbi:MAG: Crp/Fnr family transcriptional regulator, partial [Syntrophobacteraceae bacterium]|nr:Crp/Fnr family transcriptional regulator [Syntrophobacteraceae bacterium]
MRVAERIARIALFEGLPQEQLDELSRIVVEQGFKKGQSLFADGMKAAGMYGIISGKVKIYKMSLEGKEQILHIFGEGEFFGEVPVFAGGNYPAHAEALEDSRFLFFPRAEFVRLIQREPSLAMNMLAILSLRLRRFTHLIEDLSLKEVPGRLAAYLLYMSDRDGGSSRLELDITKGQLASVLGTIPETLSRILGRMSQQELIRVEGRKIEILDREALEGL